MAKKLVLIVDDETNIRSFVKRALGKNYNVIEASNGEEALEVIRSKKPDIVLLDIMMPSVDGYTVCSTIKADPATQMIPVIMATGLGYQLNKELADKLGADGYLVKPFTAEILRSTIEQYLDE